MQTILYTNDISSALRSLIGEMTPSSVHIVTDTNVLDKVLPALSLPYPVIVTEPGDVAKNLSALSRRRCHPKVGGYKYRWRSGH